MSYIRVDLIPDLDKQVAEMVAAGDTPMDAAEKIASAARDLAPVESGDYQSGIIAQRTPGGARVLATDYKSRWIEFGVPSRGIPARWVLRRAAESVGLKFRKRR